MLRWTPWMGLAALLAAGPAAAGETACWFENGAVVAPAAAGTIAGDFIIDFSAPGTAIHETRAQMEGFESGQALSLPLNLAGMTVPDQAETVVDLDARSWGFDTPIAGVLGVDALSRFVIDLSFAPCRINFYERGREPAFKADRTLPLSLAGGAAAVSATVSDGETSLTGLFAVDTASKAVVRIAKGKGEVTSPPPKDVNPEDRNAAPASLRALSFGGGLVERPSAAIATELPPDVLGALGVGLWSGYRLRIDLAGGALKLRKMARP